MRLTHLAKMAFSEGRSFSMWRSTRRLLFCLCAHFIYSARAVVQGPCWKCFKNENGVHPVGTYRGQGNDTLIYSCTKCDCHGRRSNCRSCTSNFNFVITTGRVSSLLVLTLGESATSIKGAFVPILIHVQLVWCALCREIMLHHP